MKQPHIYKVTNTVNGKVYIGQHDGSKAHYYASGCAIKKAIAKYGKAAFEREIVVSGDFGPEELDALEVHYIAHFQAYAGDYPDKGYNLTRGGVGLRGFRHTPDAIGLMRRRSPRRKMVVQFDEHGIALAAYSSAKFAADSVGVSGPSLYRCCTGALKSAGGFRWMFASDYRKAKHLPTQQDRLRRAVAQYDFHGNLLGTFESASDASRRTGAGRSAIVNNLSGHSASACGSQWRYVDLGLPQTMPVYAAKANAIALCKARTAPVDMLSLDGQWLQSFPSCEEAAKFVGGAVSGIRQCCLGKYSSSHGYVFRYQAAPPRLPYNTHNSKSARERHQKPQ